ncbi:histone-lysine N-methyltransferase eggless-like [Contarinia nasturtii]|uniref:histone-lysine N-methyltransferase eggless-like n=1 Tax=Contarinia nasturtii TaxID=265458 RepID=UPI0012D44596|nr:histone-lysine N-methyltransferase eggless-like [Contarinia nasturtii]
MYDGLEPIEISDDDEISIYEDEVSILNIKTPAPLMADERKLYWADKTRKNNVIASWKQCELLSRQVYVNEFEEEQEMCLINMFDRKLEVPNYKLAMAKSSRQDYHNYSRVLAFRKRVDLPYIINEFNQMEELYPSQDNEPYAGMIASRSNVNDHFYMVFFDDGHVQKINWKDIRLVLGNDGLSHVHSNAKKYFEFFASLSRRHEIDMTKLDIGHFLWVECNGEWIIGEVKDKDKELPLIQFELTNGRHEWLYSGSPRIGRVWRHFINLKLLDASLQFNFMPEVVDNSDNDCILIELPIVQPRTRQQAIESTIIPLVNSSNLRLRSNHQCNHNCIELEDKADLTGCGLFQRPLAIGFERVKSGYVAPCGQVLKDYKAIEQYLATTKAKKIRIDSFSLDKDFDPSANFCSKAVKNPDISFGKEKIPISASDKPLNLDENLDENFNYITDYRFPNDYLTPNIRTQCCDCTDNCANKLKCSCWHLTVEKAIGRKPNQSDLKEYKNYGYIRSRLCDTERLENGIVECGENCKCSKEACVNRVVQHGLQLNLQVFDTKSRGRGVRTLTDIPAKTFVVSYYGEVIDQNDAEGRTFTYFFSLGHQSIATPNLDDRPSHAKRPRINTDDHDVKQVFVNFFPTYITWPKDTDSSSDDESDTDDKDSAKKHKIEYVVDSNNFGNVSRFFNHSCEPNMFAQDVFLNDFKFPTLAFFTNTVVKAGTELTFDYAYNEDDKYKTKCLCGARSCRKRLI